MGTEKTIQTKRTDAVIDIIFAVDSYWRRNPPRYTKADIKKVEKAIKELGINREKILRAMELENLI